MLGTNSAVTSNLPLTSSVPRRLVQTFLLGTPSTEFMLTTEPPLLHPVSRFSVMSHPTDVLRGLLTVSKDFMLGLHYSIIGPTPFTSRPPNAPASPLRYRGTHHPCTAFPAPARTTISSAVSLDCARRLTLSSRVPRSFIATGSR